MASWNEKNRWEGWKRSKDLARDQPFYINTVTGHRQWDEPAVPASQRPNKFGPHELPLLVQMLWRDKHTFSTSYWRDQWVVLKNRHIFFSIFLVHPLHPFNKLERLLLLMCTVLFGFGLSALIVVLLELVESEALAGNRTEDNFAYVRYNEFRQSEYRWVIIVMSTVFVQALYDNFAKVLFICSCSQMLCLRNKPKCTACLERFARYATFVCLALAVVVAAWTVYLPFKEGETAEWSVVLQTWGITRAIGWLGTATLVVVIKFAIKRRTEAKAYRKRGDWGEPSKDTWMTGGASHTPWPALEQLTSRPPSEPSLCSNVCTSTRGTVTLRGSAKVWPAWPPSAADTATAATTPAGTTRPDSTAGVGNGSSGRANQAEVSSARASSAGGSSPSAPVWPPSGDS